MNGGEVTREEMNKVWKHIETTNKEMGVLCAKQTSISTDVTWLKKFQWLILTTAMGGVIIGLFRLSVGI